MPGLPPDPVQTLVDQGPGGAEGSRTPDLVIANDALYQLSYGPQTPRITGAGERATYEGRSGGVNGLGVARSAAPESMDAGILGPGPRSR